jgi:outer membrane protein with beta-barrel domain
LRERFGEHPRPYTILSTILSLAIAMSHFSRCLFVCLVIRGLLFVSPARAQEEFSRFEVGANFAAFRAVSDVNADVSFYPGLGGRFTYNLSRRLAFEAEIAGVPEGVPPTLLTQGGGVFSLVFGTRAKILQSRRFSVFGLLRPGLLHFGGVGDTKNTAIEFHPHTFFMLNLGGGVEYYPAPRWIVRFDITGNPYRIPNSFEQVPLPGGPTMKVGVPGEINDQFRLTFGVGYRLGKLRENPREGPVSGKLELGPQFTTTLMQRRISATGVQTEPGVGGFACYQFFRFLYADGSLVYYPRGSQPGFQDGGTLFGGLFGLKGGIRRDRLGLFGKFRPGFLRSSDVVTGFTSEGTAVEETLGKYHTFAVDFGGVIEVYTTKRQLIRIDLGDTHLYYHTTHITQPDGSITTLKGGVRQHSIQTSISYAWRF